jgi:hypothetical protein
MTHLDGAVLHCVEHLQTGHDLARGEHLNLKLILAELGNPSGHVFRRAVERIE